MNLITVTPQNAHKESLFCIKDTKSNAFQKKLNWFEGRVKEGLILKIMKNEEDKPIAFIEYCPVEYAWRPVMGNNFMFIQCMFVYSNKDRLQGAGSMLIKDCEETARSLGMDGVCTISSKGSWIHNKLLFEKNGYEQIDKVGRFELMLKKFNNEAEDPKLIDWTQKPSDFKGWHLIYADQCPWHEKSVQAISKVCSENGIKINVKRLESAEQTQNAPSGFGTFALIYNGKLLEDHYLSETRFRNILGEIKN